MTTLWQLLPVDKKAGINSTFSGFWRHMNLLTRILNLPDSVVGFISSVEFFLTLQHYNNIRL